MSTWRQLYIRVYCSPLLGEVPGAEVVESEVGVVEHERGGVSPATSRIFLIRCM